jgi:hypothetical protein
MRLPGVSKLSGHHTEEVGRIARVEDPHLTPALSPPYEGSGEGEGAERFVSFQRAIGMATPMIVFEKSQ